LGGQSQSFARSGKTLNFFGLIIARGLNVFIRKTTKRNTVALKLLKGVLALYLSQGPYGAILVSLRTLLLRLARATRKGQKAAQIPPMGLHICMWGERGDRIMHMCRPKGRAVYPSFSFHAGVDRPALRPTHVHDPKRGYVGALGHWRSSHGRAR